MDFSEAQARFVRLSQFAAQDVANKRLALDAANAGIAAREPKAAAAILQKTLTHWPGDGELMFALGTALLASSEYTSAADQFAAMLAAAEAHPAIRYNLAYAYARLGDYDAARDALAPMSEAEAQEIPEVYQLRGRAAHHLEKLDEAIRWFRRYASARPESATAWGELALAGFDGDDGATARIAAEQALKLDADNVNAHLALGGMALEQREIAPSLEHFGVATRQHAENGRAWSGLAFARMLQLDFDQAKRDFETAVRYMPDHIGTWHGLGWLQILQKDLEGAELSFQKALALDRNFGETHGGLAVIAALRGQTEDAEKMARRGVGLNPQSFAARYARTLVLSSKGREAEAREGVDAIITTASPDGKEGFEKMVSDLLAQIPGAGKGKRGKRAKKH